MFFRYFITQIRYEHFQMLIFDISYLALKLKTLRKPDLKKHVMFLALNLIIDKSIILKLTAQNWSC